MTGKPNFIFLIIDALRADRLQIGGYRSGLTPTIDKLAQKGLYCSQHFSVGCPTQVAFPGIWTSSLPLDYGGYTEGIFNRQVFLAEELREAGYNTLGITTAHPCSSHYGYNRGFDTFIDLIDMHLWFRSNYIAAFGDWMRAWRDKKIDNDQLLELLIPKYEKVLDDTLIILDTLERVKAPQQGGKREKWRLKTIAEKKLFASDPMAVVCKIDYLEGLYDMALGEPCISEKVKRRLRRDKFLSKQMNRRIFLRSRRKAYTGGEVNRQVSKLFKQRKDSNPYFLYIHLFDLHESKLLVPNMTCNRASRLFCDLRRLKRARSAGGGGFLYDMGLIDIDHHVGQLLKTINKYDDLENTYIVFTGDHGTLAGKPHRPRKQDLAYLFYDNFIHVPLGISGPGISHKIINSLNSHLDLGPTILDLANIKKPAGMRGTSVFQDNGRSFEFVLAESGGSGRCEIKNKPFYLAIRTKQLKSTFMVNNFKLKEREVYNLVDDPDEYNNLINSNLFQSERNEMKLIAENRIQEIKDHQTAVYT